MELMGTLLSSDGSTANGACGSHYSTTDLQNLVPRLWPFLAHNINSVRKSSLLVLFIILGFDSATNATLVGGDVLDGAPGANCGGDIGVKGEAGRSWLQGLLQPLMCQVFQRFLLEGDQENRELLHEVLPEFIRSLFRNLTCNKIIIMSVSVCLPVYPVHIRNSGCLHIHYTHVHSHY